MRQINDWQKDNRNELSKQPTKPAGGKKRSSHKIHRMMTNQVPYTHHLYAGNWTRWWRRQRGRGTRGQQTNHEMTKYMAQRTEPGQRQRQRHSYWQQGPRPFRNYWIKLKTLCWKERDRDREKRQRERLKEPFKDYTLWRRFMIKN